jgi:hypothetical protein
LGAKRAVFVRNRYSLRAIAIARRGASCAAAVESLGDAAAAVLADGCNGETHGLWVSGLGLSLGPGSPGFGVVWCGVLVREEGGESDGVHL